jgi:hypothetical protein
MSRKQRNVRTIAALGCVLAAGGCDGSTAQNDEINVNPVTHEEASASLEQINARPGDPAAQLALERIRPALDRLNGLVARVEAEPGRIISFYEPSPGQIMVSERGPMDGRRLLAEHEVKGQSVADLYRRLAGAEAPAALIAAQSRELEALATGTEVIAAIDGQPGATASSPAVRPTDHGDVVTVSSALGAADGPWFRQHACFVQEPGGADFANCLPEWNNGGFAQASAKTSFMTVAPYAGNGVTVRMQYSSLTKIQDPVATGEWLAWWWHSSTYSSIQGPKYNVRTHRWDILNASGDWFHWSFAFKWSCRLVDDCNDWPNSTPQ